MKDSKIKIEGKKMNLLRFEDTPTEYHGFRHNWTNFENILQNKYPRVENILEKARKFGAGNESMFNEFDRELIKQIITQECVHNDQYKRLKDYVVVSTQILRKTLEISNEVCRKCSKSEECSKLSIGGMNYNNMQAILQIIYQIRNNINHHGKSELTKRNINLVIFADQIMSQIVGNYI